MLLLQGFPVPHAKQEEFGIRSNKLRPAHSRSRSSHTTPVHSPTVDQQHRNFFCHLKDFKPHAYLQRPTWKLVGDCHAGDWMSRNKDREQLGAQPPDQIAQDEGFRCSFLVKFAHGLQFSRVSTPTVRLRRGVTVSITLRNEHLSNCRADVVLKLNSRSCSWNSGVISHNSKFRCWCSHHTTDYSSLISTDQKAHQFSSNASAASVPVSVGFLVLHFLCNHHTVPSSQTPHALHPLRCFGRSSNHHIAPE